MIVVRVGRRARGLKRISAAAGGATAQVTLRRR